MLMVLRCTLITLLQMCFDWRQWMLTVRKYVNRIDDSHSTESSLLHTFMCVHTGIGQLMKRYFLVEKAKNASLFGVVIGTLGVGMYL